MKKGLFIGLILMILLVIGFTSINDNSDDKDEVLKVGVIASMTDPGALRGESVVKGLELAEQKIKSELGVDIEIVIQDVPLNAAGDAPIVLNKLAQIDKVDAIIGPMGSNVVLAISSIVDQYKIPVIVHAASALDVTKDNEYIFRLWTTADNYADEITREVNNLGYENIAMLTTTLDNTVQLQNFIKDRSSDSSFDVVFDEQVLPEATDFRTQLLKIKSTENVNAIFLNLYEGQFAIAARQARELGIEKPLFANAVFTQAEVNIDKESTEGIWYPIFSGYTKEAGEEFIELFGEEPSAPDSAAAAHDALMALAHAFKNVGDDGEKMKNYLYENNFSGSMGEFNFLESGDAIVSLTLKEVRNGEVVDRE